jgi:serine O-acetyltransferase
MPDPSTDPQRSDPVWTAIRAEAWSDAERDPYLNLFLTKTILKSKRLESALGLILSSKLATECVNPALLQSRIDEALAPGTGIGQAVRYDLQAIRDRDPASRGFLIPFLFFKGFHALQAYRIAHWLWLQGQQLFAAHLQNRISELFAVDIHPAANIGSGILLDHATGIVIGETAVVDDNVSMLHGVTLGGTGKETGDRHPKVRQGVLIGAGAKILGNVEIGEGAKIGAGSVVLDSVPAHCTAAGVPAKIVARGCVDTPALEMDQQFPHQQAEGSGI